MYWDYNGATCLHAYLPSQCRIPHNSALRGEGGNMLFFSKTETQILFVVSTGLQLVRVAFRFK